MGWGWALIEFEWDREGVWWTLSRGWARILPFSAFRMGAYSRWALIRGWALIPINTVNQVVANLLNTDL